MKNIYFYYFATIAPLALLIYLVRLEFINSVIFSILIVSYSLIYRTYVDGKRLVDKTIITKAEIWSLALPGRKIQYFKALYLSK